MTIAVDLGRKATNQPKMDVITLRFVSENHVWFIDFIAWRYITSRGDVML